MSEVIAGHKIESEVEKGENGDPTSLVILPLNCHDLAYNLLDGMMPGQYCAQSGFQFCDQLSPISLRLVHIFARPCVGVHEPWWNLGTRFCTDMDNRLIVLALKMPSPQTDRHTAFMCVQVNSCMCKISPGLVSPWVPAEEWKQMNCVSLVSILSMTADSLFH